MEGSPSTNDNSDSDSSESWTFIDQKVNIPTDSETQSPVVNPDGQRNADERMPTVIQDDEETDTDGIAVITDEEEEVTSTTAETVTCASSITQSLTYLADNIKEENPKNKNNKSSQPKLKGDNSDVSSSTTVKECEEELLDDFYVEDSKIRSYVHKRNNKISGFLNVVLIGTVITAAGIAVGHMWGINDDCSLDMLNSVSQVLSNLQKLKEENDALKSQIKTLQSAQQQPMHYNIMKPAQFFSEIDRRLKEEKETKMFTDKLEEILREGPLEPQDDYESKESVTDVNPRVRREAYFSPNKLGKKMNEIRNPLRYETSTINSDNINETISDKRKPYHKKERKNSNRKPKYMKKKNCPQSQSGGNVNYIGPKTYCEYYTNISEYKQKSKHVPSVKTDSPKIPLAYTKSSKNIPKSNVGRKEKFQKEQKKYKYQPVNLTQYAHRQHEPIAAVDSDWYYRMAMARQQMRMRSVPSSREDGALWYFKRMNDREKSRLDTKDFLKQFSKRNIDNQPMYKSKR